MHKKKNNEIELKNLIMKKKNANNLETLKLIINCTIKTKQELQGFQEVNLKQRWLLMVVKDTA